MAGCPPGAAPVVPWAPISDGTGASAALNFLAASKRKNTQFFTTNFKIFQKFMKNFSAKLKGTVIFFTEKLKAS